MERCKKNQGLCALYVHVPFCRSKCRYCDFYSRIASVEAMERYACLVLDELRLRELSAEEYDSIYVGGGTPTVLPTEAAERLLEHLGQRLAVGGEFSVEANPATLTAERADLLRRAGVTRVTVGAQSFHDDELAVLGRIHRNETVGKAICRLREAGITNVGLDLMYGIPGSSPLRWRDSLRSAIALHVEHISCYALSIEPGTPMGRDWEAGRIAEVDDETQRAMHAAAVEMLGEAGYEWYEVSNFARPGRQSRQNRVYWRNEPYLGVGPAACSYVDGWRRTNAADFDAWAAALEADEDPPHEQERLVGVEALAETLMLGLRLREGVSLRTMAERFGMDVRDVLGGTVRKHLDSGLLAMDERRMWLPAEHVFVMNEVLADFVAEAQRNA